MIFKAVYRKAGGHYDVAVFVAPAMDRTFAKLGDLTMDDRDWRAFKRSVRVDAADRPEGAPCWTFEEA